MQKKIIRLSLAAALILASCGFVSAYINLNLPTNYVTLTVHYPASNSYFTSELKNIPAGYDVYNGTFVGWCGDKYKTIRLNYDYTSTRLYSVYDTSMPSYLWNDNWTKVNYVLNHKVPSVSWWQIQYAIWYLLGYNDTGLDSDGWSMVNDAILYGDAYNPSYFDITGIIADPGQNTQRHFLEFRPLDENIYNLTVTDAFNGKLALAWDPAVHSFGIDHYEIFRDGARLADVTTPSYLDTGLTIGVEYSYTVRIVDLDDNNGKFSDPVSGISTDTEPPSKVQNLVVNDAFNGNLSLSWDPAVDNDHVDHYEIFRDGLWLTNVTTTSYLDTGLVIGTLYTYKVRAVDASGLIGDFSDEHSGVSTDTLPPSKVQNLIATDAKDGKIDLSWDPATDNVAVASYEIYRDGGYIDTVTTLVYHDTGRTIGQVYHYTVRAVDTAGNKGAFSDIVDQMSTSSSSPTPPTPPAPPASGHMTVNEHPIADLSAGEPYRGYTDEALWLDGSRSHDPDGFLITWAWDFGDGTTGTGERAAHSYSHIGLYSVTLTVWDNQGASATDTTTVQILQSNRAPSTPLIRGSRDGFTYLKQYYSIVSTDPDNDLLTYTIEWGDGTTNVSPAMSSDVSYLIAHTWNSSGPYTIHVSVSDGHLTAFNNLTVTIRETPMTNNIALLILGLLILIALLLLFLLSRRKKKNTE